MSTTRDSAEATQDPTLQELTTEEQRDVLGGYGIIIRRPRRAYES